jgi:hypothetical protein
MGVDTANQQPRTARQIRIGILLGPVGALTIVMGIIFASDFVKGIGVGVGAVGLILFVKAWRSGRTETK